MIKKVISGAQIGADIAGLRAAKALGLETGGWMPLGFRARDGSHPEYALEYGIQEHVSALYPPRTGANVFYSDGTVRFAFDFQSAGEICTLKAIKRYHRPYFDVDLVEGEPIDIVMLLAFRHWLQMYDIAVLNVAGNAATWVEPVVEDFLRKALVGSSTHVRET